MEAEAREEIRSEKPGDQSVDGIAKTGARETLNGLFGSEAAADASDGSSTPGDAAEGGTDAAADEQSEADAAEEHSEDVEA